MRRLVHCPDAHYAVIEASSNKDHPERLMMPIQMRSADLIAAPSILKLGFASCEQAMAKLAAEMRGSLFQNKDLEPQNCLVQEHAGLAKGLTLLKNGTAHRVLHYALSTFVFVFYSKNLLSTTIRMVLGASS